MTILHWFRLWWWRFLLEDCAGWRNFWCRVRGHPAGPIFFQTSVLADEPNWYCRNCGEYIG